MKTKMKDYKVRIIDSMPKWKELAEPWNDLLEKSRSDHIFLSWEWLFSWSECFLGKDRRLFIISVYKKDELIGIAPWQIHDVMYKYMHLKQIEFLGTPDAGADYLDVFIKKGKERDVANCIYNHLMYESRSLWDSLSLRDIPADSIFLLHFQNKIEETGKYCAITNGSFCPTVELPESWDRYFTQTSSNRRQQFRRHIRLLEKEGSVAHRSSSSENIDEYIEDFFSLYGKESNHNGAPVYFLFKKFLLKCKDNTRVQVDFLNIDGVDIVGMLHLVYKFEQSMYSMVVNKTFNSKISIGNILVGFCIEKAIKNGMAKYDFLKGHESYKFHWANGGKRSLNLFLCQKKIVPMFYTIENLLKNTAKVVLR